MKKHTYHTSGVCSQKIDIELRHDNVIKSVAFTGGCPGNTMGISKLVPGMKAEDVIDLLEGNICGLRETSCPDQLARALREMVG